MWKLFVILILVAIIIALFYFVLVEMGLLNTKKRGIILQQETMEFFRDNRAIYKELLNIFLAAICLRFAVYAIGYLFTIVNIRHIQTITIDEIIDMWNRWDSPHYIDIASLGYGKALEDGRALFLVFYPLYPYLMRIVQKVVGDYAISGMLISLFSYAGACCYIYKLVHLEYNKKVARDTVILISIFPFSFFFGGIMTESLFLLLTAAGLYYIRKHRWFIASLVGCFASATRMHGLLLLIPAGIELLTYYNVGGLIREKNWRQIWNIFYQKVTCFFLMFGGTIFYLYENNRVSGNPFQFLIYQKEHWHQGYLFITSALEYIFHNAFTDKYELSSRFTIWIPNAILFIIGIIALIIGLYYLRSMYIGYFFAYFVMNYSVSWLLSGGRYMSCAIPLFIIGGILAQKSRIIKYVLILISMILFLIYLMAYMNGMHVY